MVTVGCEETPKEERGRGKRKMREKGWGRGNKGLRNTYLVVESYNMLDVKKEYVT